MSIAPQCFEPVEDDVTTDLKFSREISDLDNDDDLVEELSLHILIELCIPPLDMEE